MTHSGIRELLPSVGLVTLGSVPGQGLEEVFLAFCFSAFSKSPWSLDSSVCHLKRMGGGSGLSRGREKMPLFLWPRGRHPEERDGQEGQAGGKGYR